MNKPVTIQFRLPIAALLVVFILSACVPSGLPPLRPGDAPSNEWSYSDLRVMDAIDQTDPAADLIAVYCRQLSDQLEIRIDFLELRDTTPGDFYIALDYARGGSRRFTEDIPAGIAWEMLFSAQTSEVVFSDPTLAAQVGPGAPQIRVDVELDSVFINLSPNPLLNQNLTGLKVQVLSIQSDSNGQTWDQTRAFSFNGRPPKNRAPLLLAFWNTLEASTPAEALRDWNGAHTGPIGQRHGLFHLLSAAQENHIPIALLDLKKPSSLAALAFLGQMEWVKTLEQKGVLILPDTASGGPQSVATSLMYSRRMAQAFGLQPSTLALGAFENMDFPTGYDTAFAYFDRGDHVYSLSGRRVLPLPTPYYLSSSSLSRRTQYTILDEEGLTLQAKIRLVETALSPDGTDLTVFGGDLKNGLWADQYLSGEVFDYIARHPWIQTLAAEQLKDWKPRKLGKLGAGDCEDLLCASKISLPTSSGSSAAQALRELGANPITDSAWEMYLNLTDPTHQANPESALPLKISAVGHLAEASRWYQEFVLAPATTRCQDIDWDGQTECVLANDSIFASFEPQGGVLQSVFLKTAHGPVQLFGPSPQSILTAPDPRHTPGALWSAEDRETVFTVSELPGSLVFTSPISTKSYQLSGRTLLVQFQLAAPQVVYLALPNTSPLMAGYPAQPNFSLLKTSPGHCAFTIQLPEGETLKATLTDCNGLTAASYTDSLPYLALPEDPNWVYPPGHYLPFPLSILQVQAGPTLEILLEVD